MGDVVFAADAFLRRAVQLAPSCDPWADRITATLMVNWPDAPDPVTEAWTVYCLNYRDQSGVDDPAAAPWSAMWRAFMDGWKMDLEPDGAA